MMCHELVGRDTPFTCVGSIMLIGDKLRCWLKEKEGKKRNNAKHLVWLLQKLPVWLQLHVTAELDSVIAGNYILSFF